MQFIFWAEDLNVLGYHWSKVFNSPGSTDKVTWSLFFVLLFTNRGTNGWDARGASSISTLDIMFECSAKIFVQGLGVCGDMVLVADTHYTGNLSKGSVRCDCWVCYCMCNVIIPFFLVLYYESAISGGSPDGFKQFFLHVLWEFVHRSSHFVSQQLPLLSNLAQLKKAFLISTYTRHTDLA